MDKKQFSSLCKSSPSPLLSARVNQSNRHVAMSWSKCHSGRHRFSAPDGTAELNRLPHKADKQCEGDFPSWASAACGPHKARGFPQRGIFEFSASACEPWQLDVPRGDVRCLIDSGELPLFLPERIKIGSSIWASRW